MKTSPNTTRHVSTFVAHPPTMGPTAIPAPATAPSLPDRQSFATRPRRQEGPRTGVEARLFWPRLPLGEFGR